MLYSFPFMSFIGFRITLTIQKNFSLNDFPQKIASLLMLSYFVIHLPCQTGMQRHFVLLLSVRPSVRLFVRLLPNLWMWYFANERTDFEGNWHKWYLEQGHEIIKFGVRRSKFKVTQGQSRSQKSLLARFWPNMAGTYYSKCRVCHNISCAGSQKWRLGEARDRFGGLMEASF